MAGVSAGSADNAQSELASRLYGALGAGDREELLRLLHPGFEGRLAASLPAGIGGTYRGPDAMCSAWELIGRLFRVRAIETARTDLPDGRLLIEGKYTGCARHGGPLEASFVHLLRFADGRIIGLEQQTDSAQWVAALHGLRSDEAERRKSADPQPERARSLTSVTFDVEDGLAVLRLNRPDARNAIDAAVAADLAEATQRCAADPTVRALLICANGPTFSVGGDIEMLAASGPAELPGTLRRLTTSYHASLQILGQLPVPVVAAVQGAVAGGALGLLYAADIVIAADGTRFAAGFAGLGLSGDGGGTWFLPRLIGTRRAAELYLGQRVLSPAEALDWGLITRVVPAAELESEGGALARALARGPTRAFGELRGLLRQAPEANLADHYRAETEALARTAATLDAQAGIAAFRARSRPHFRGE